MKALKPCLKGLWSLLRPVLPKVLGCSLLYLAEAVCSLFFVWYCKKVVDIATGTSSASLELNVGVLVLIMALQILFRVFSQKRQGYVSADVKLKIRRDAFDKAIRGAWSGQDKYHSADVVNRLEEDIRVVSEFICAYLPVGVVTVLQLIAACVMLFTFSPSLALILVWIMPVAVVAAKLYFRKLRRLSTELRTLDGRIQGHVQENLQSRTLIKSLGAEHLIEETLDSLQSEELDITRTKLKYSAVSRAFMQVGFSAGYLTAFLFGVFGLKDGSVTYGMMVAFLQLVGQVQRPVANLASYVPAFIKALSSEERLLDIDEMDAEEIAHQVILSGDPAVEVRDVSFAYDGRTPVFEHFSCAFKAGRMTAVCGPTGEGKSTLAKLLLGLLRPSSGHIVLTDGVQSIEAGIDARGNFMYVPQGNSLLSGSIRENLLLADSQATEEQMREALHTAAADFVFELPLGMDTLCSEVGRGLSEGQGQRIAIARALLKKGGILILDEATSALDSETEAQVLERIHEKYHGRKTIICITHKPAAAEISDAIVNL